jgi:hypothetical protein
MATLERRGWWEKTKQYLGASNPKKEPTNVLELSSSVVADIPQYPNEEEESIIEPAVLVNDPVTVENLKDMVAPMVDFVPAVLKPEVAPVIMPQVPPVEFDAAPHRAPTIDSEESSQLTSSLPTARKLIPPVVQGLVIGGAVLTIYVTGQQLYRWLTTRRNGKVRKPNRRLVWIEDDDETVSWW